MNLASPEPEKIDLITKVILGAWIGACSGAVLLFVRLWLKAEIKNFTDAIKVLSKRQGIMNGSVREVMRKEQTCRENLPREYVGINAFNLQREETSKMLGNLFNKFDELMEHLAFEKGKPKTKKKKGGD